MGVKNCDIPSVSPWIRRFSDLLPSTGTVLDLAAGAGRHSRWFAERGHDVVAVDRRTDDLLALRREMEDSGAGKLEVLRADLEDGSPWPLPGRRFDGVIVVNYLHRPLFPDLLAAIADGGALLYETFAIGNERYGKPANPDFLLGRGELLDVVRDRLQVVAFEHGLIEGPGGSAVKQRIAAVRGTAPRPLAAP